MGSPRVMRGRSVPELVDAVRGRLSPAALAQLKALGLSTEGRVPAGYPADSWAQCVRVIAQDIFPSLDETEAQRRVGHMRMDQVSRLIKVLMRFSGLTGRERALEGFVTRVRDGASFVNTRFTVVGPRRYEAWISDVAGVPGFFWGILEAGSRMVCGDIDAVRIKAHDGEAYTFEIKRL